jgi:hypothetical protein
MTAQTIANRKSETIERVQMIFIPPQFPQPEERYERWMTG